MIDVEEILVSIDTFLKANLNTQIGLMNSEKNDSITLQTVSNSAYFIQTLNDAIANYNPYVLLGVSNIQSVGIGPGTGKGLSFEVVLILQDGAQDLSIGIRMLRYLRVLEDLFNKNFNKVLPHVSFKVNSLVPIALTAINSNDPFRAVGVELVTTLG